MEKVTYLLLKRLAKQVCDAKKRIAIIGDCATQQLATAIAGESVRRGYPLNVYDADYDQMAAQLLDPQSELYGFSPDYILLFACTEKLKLRFYDMLPSERVHFADRECERFCQYWQAVHANCSAQILMPDFPEQEDAVFGSFALREPRSFAYQLRRLNALLCERMASDAAIYPIALGAVRMQLGSEHFSDPRTWYLAKMAVQTDALPVFASRILDTILAVSGRIKKCIITDLDNTLWGGVIGDDGIDGIQLGELGDGPAFQALQQMLLEYRRRGILLAVCSKNNEDTAKEPFLRHPEMLLRLEDIAVFVANWENKADNIRKIRETLNLGMDSFVFLDDNPFERNLVREMLPEVTVPELPEDPALVPAFLESLHLFEPAGYSEEDAARTAQYQAEASRVQAQASFTNYEDYLVSLDMQAEILPFDSFHFPRIAQLTQRSNQFNLRTVRYTEQQIASLAADPAYLTRYMTLSDRYGEHGLISTVILKKLDDALFIDTWLMSCRVLRRGVEKCLFNAVVSLCRKAGCRYLIGEYLPTAKNKMVESFYADLGMESLGQGRYRLDCAAFEPFSHCITVSSDEK